MKQSRLYKISRGYLNADVNAVRNYLKKLGKFDLFSALAKPVRVRIFKSISVSSLYGQIGGRSRGGVNPPVVVRHPLVGAVPPEAPHL